MCAFAKKHIQTRNKCVCDLFDRRNRVVTARHFIFVWMFLLPIKSSSFNFQKEKDYASGLFFPFYLFNSSLTSSKSSFASLASDFVVAVTSAAFYLLHVSIRLLLILFLLQHHLRLVWPLLPLLLPFPSCLQRKILHQ